MGLEEGARALPSGHEASCLNTLVPGRPLVCVLQGYPRCPLLCGVIKKGGGPCRPVSWRSGRVTCKQRLGSLGRGVGKTTLFIKVNFSKLRELSCAMQAGGASEQQEVRPQGCQREGVALLEPHQGNASGSGSFLRPAVAGLLGLAGSE